MVGSCGSRVAVAYWRSYAACAADLVGTVALCLVRPGLFRWEDDYSLWSECYARPRYGSLTLDVAALAAVRTLLAVIVIAGRRRWLSAWVLDRWEKELNLVELLFALSKGISRALGAGAKSCAPTETLWFDTALAAFVIFGFAVPAVIRRDLSEETRDAAARKRRKMTTNHHSAEGGSVLDEPLLSGGGAEEEEDGALKAQREADEAAGKWKKTVHEIFKLTRPEIPLLSVAVVFAFLAALCTSGVSLWTGDALDALIKGGDGPAFRQTLVELAVISAFGALCTGTRGGCFSFVGVRVNVRVRDKLFRHLLGLELGFFDATPTGDLNSRLSSDAAKIGDQVSLNFNVFFRTGVQLVTTLAFMVHTSPPLTAMAFAAVPVIGVATKRYGKVVWGLSRRMQDHLAKAQTVAEEALSSMRTVRSMGGEACVAADFSDHLIKGYGAVGSKQAVAYVVWQTFNTALPNLMTCLLLFYGGRLVDHGELRSGRLVAFMLLTQSLSDSFNTLADMYSSIADALGAADKVFDLLAREPDEKDRPAAVFEAATPDVFACRGLVELQDVHFSYPSRPDARVLEGLTLRIRPGAVVALVGPSGSGKSSVLALIQHLYAPARGTVTLDGRAVASLRHLDLHRAVATVGQEPVLFMRSIERNIKYALEHTPFEPSRASVDDALRQAHAAAFVDGLPAKLETNVGERGVTMSGGQKQRLAIARALVRKPAVLLLDEATSALDAESERLVQDALDDLIKSHQITVVVVAHRLSTIQNADEICVMRDGKLVEQGTHANLLRQDGAYADLVHRQTAAATAHGDPAKKQEHDDDDDNNNGPTTTTTTTTTTATDAPPPPDAG